MYVNYILFRYNCISNAKTLRCGFILKRFVIMTIVSNTCDSPPTVDVELWLESVMRVEESVHVCPG